MLTLGGGIAMFEPKENPGYDKLTDDAAQLIAKWTKNDWYDSSAEADIGEADVGGAETDASQAEMALG